MRQFFMKCSFILITATLVACSGKDGTTATAPLTSGIKLSFLGNGSDGGHVPAAQHLESGTTNNLPSASAMTRAGYEFLGWSSTASGDSDFFAGGSGYTMPSTDTNLYAQWQRLLHVATTGDDTLGSGTPTAPYATINKALAQALINQASAFPPYSYEVKVGAGNYTTAGKLTLLDNMVMEGGFDANWTEDVPNQISKVTQTTAGDPVFDLLSLTSLHTMVQLHGFTMEAINPNQSLGAVGVRITDCPRVAVYQNIITVRGWNAQSTGIQASGMIGGFFISNKIIANLGGERRVFGIEFSGLSDNSGAYIVNNIIDTDATPVNDDAAGIRIAAATGETTSFHINNNDFIVGGKSGGKGAAVSEQTDSAIDNGTIELDFNNNIIFAGPQQDVSTSDSWGLNFGSTSILQIDAIKNNNFFNLTGLVSLAGSDATDVAGLNALTNASENISTEMLTAGFFINPGSLNFHLSNSTTSDIFAGGLDLSSSDFNFNRDYDNNLRTGNTSDGWSMGAFEFDLP